MAKKKGMKKGHGAKMVSLNEVGKSEGMDPKSLVSIGRKTDKRHADAMKHFRCSGD